MDLFDRLATLADAMAEAARKEDECALLRLADDGCPEPVPYAFRRLEASFATVMAEG